MDTAPAAAHVVTDPTKTLWRRIFAWLIDGLAAALVLGAAMAAVGDVDFVDAPRCPDRVPEGDVCIELDQDDGTGDAGIVYLDRGGSAAAVGAVLLFGLLNHVVLQGVTGATVGKFLTACRVVRPDGRRPGIGRALVRTLLLVVDGINVILPVGLWIAMFSRGHRRLGDMVAGTYVVKARDAGRPLPAFVT